MRALATAALVGAALALTVPAAGAGPSMAAKMSATTLDLGACKQRAQDVAKKASFKVSKVLELSVFAENGDYSVMIRCVPEKGAVFFAVAGPRSERTANYADEIAENF